MRDEMRFVERLNHDLREIRWAEPAELRARAARRRRRAVLGAATAVLLMAAASAVVTKSLVPPPATSLADSAAAVPYAEIPRDAMVQPSDLAVRSELPLAESGLGAPVRIDSMLLACHQEQGLAAEWETSRYSRSQTLLRSHPDGARRGPADPLFSQDVYRLAPQVATRIFARIDALLAPCANWRVRGEAQWGDRFVLAEVSHRWEAVDRDFAGDEAMMIEHSVVQARNLETGETRGPERLGATAVVRVGDLVTVMGLGSDGTQSELRRVAVVAADRLCAVANPPC